MISRLYRFGSKYQKRRGKDQSDKDLARALVSQEHSGIFRFADFYRKFIRNLNRIVVQLISILQITNNNNPNTQIGNNKTNHNVYNNTGNSANTACM